MSRALVRGAVGVALAGAALAVASPAAASDAEDVITEYAMTISFDDDGRARVDLDLTVDFGVRPNHGPYLKWVVKERYDDEQDRVYRITDFRARSSTAPDAVSTEELLGSGVTETAYRIGDEDVTITGEHTYRISFDVEGWVNPAAYPFPDGALSNDELYVDVLTHWDIPVQDVSIDVLAPGEVLQVACYDDGRDACTATSGGRVASFATDRVDPYTPLTLAIAYPAGTFPGAEPILQERWAFERAFAVTPATGGAAAAVALGGGALVLYRARRTGRDEQYLGLTPGLAPTTTQAATIGARQRGPVTVQFTPPAGLRAGQLGTLIDEVAHPHDVTATLIDLAVRGHLRIWRVPSTDGSDEGDWQLDRLPAPMSDLNAYEDLLLTELFDGKPAVRLSDLRTTFSTSMARVQEALYADVTAQGWFRKNPKAARAAWGAWGALLLVGGVAATVLLAIRTHAAILGVPLVVLGILWLALTKAAPARTADGTAVLAQTEGFRHYLATAEANQLRFEEGEDLFSRYLPFAVAFGLTERWAQLFAQLAAQGRALAEPTWFAGPFTGHAPFWATAGTLGQELSSFTSTATSALTAPPPSSSGSSGGSGFSGGGGGGGVGGGGGGTW